SLVLSVLALAPPSSAATMSAPLEPKVVNGLATAGYPSVGIFVSGSAACSATLIGCSTVLTAAHCICIDPKTGRPLTGAQCALRSDLLDPATKLVYFQSAGRFAVSSVAVNPTFSFGDQGDVAIVHLASPVTGIAPAAIDTTAKPALGTPAVIAGFGITEDPASGAGIKRTGALTVAACNVNGLNAAAHVCATLSTLLGPAGSNSTPCHGDSGGPLFVDFGAGPVIAGTTSGGDSASLNCTPPDHVWFASVYDERAWILTSAGSDLGTTACGGIPAAGGPSSTLSSTVGTLSPLHSNEVVPLVVPPSATHLRVGLTAESFGANDYNLYLKSGAAPTLASYDCKSDGKGTLAFCDLPAPAAGPWYALVDGASGPGGPYQLVTTLYATGSLAAPCVPTPTALCLDDRPGDRRFKVEVAYQTAQNGGLAGAGNAVSLGNLGLARGGAFWFFSPDNPEMLFKVLNACNSATPRYWVFFSAGTNVGLTVTVTDTATGHVKVYSNPDLHTAVPVSDTDGLPCS
ncbi:MAG TPA: trypsin-like serine protease, partial [Thermoanaerobaculia bacterium]|nr:trypsin-like serine protease [Thermoanaerobaculia bacterium]